VSHPRPSSPEAGVEGRPAFAVADADREAVAEALADLLVAALDNGVIDRGDTERST
jgi:hypothetical protein